MIGHEDTKGEKYSSTLPLTSTLDDCVRLTPRCGRFIPGSHSVEDWIELRSFLVACLKTHTHRDAVPDCSSPYW